MMPIAMTAETARIVLAPPKMPKAPPLLATCEKEKNWASCSRSPSSSEDRTISFVAWSSAITSAAAPRKGRWRRFCERAGGASVSAAEGGAPAISR